jgi:hypothetical protein
MKRLTTILLDVLVLVAALALLVGFPDLPIQDPFERQAAILAAGEAALYFTGAIALFFLAAYLKALAGAKRVQGRQQLQALEFICRQFEDRYGERCEADPRGPKA